MSDVVLKGELHTSRADLEEAKDQVLNGPDTVLVEGREPSMGAFDMTEGWFALSVLSFFWILENVYASDEVLVDLARAQGATVIYTRASDMEMLDAVPIGIKLLAAGAFYLLIPASIWVGFLTGSQLTGAYLLFLGIVTPIFLVRGYELRGTPNHREQHIALEIVEAVHRGDDILAVVGNGHLDKITDELPDDMDLEVLTPEYGPWSVAHLKDIGMPMFKAALVLFSVYLLSVWITVQVVDSITVLLHLGAV